MSAPESLTPSDRYDAIVVGTGIGGLTAAALLAYSGKKVLAVERHDRVGGYAHSFRRGAYTFDAAVHLIGGCDSGGLIDQLLTSLGVRDRCDFMPVNPCYRAEYPGLNLDAPTGTDEFTATYQAAFPHESRGIAAFLQDCHSIRKETRRLLANDRAATASGSLSGFSTLQRYRRSSVSDVLNGQVTDPKARTALTTLWPYVGLPPSQLSFLYWASMLMSYVDDGAYYCKGTFQVFANTLADVVRDAGGDVALRTSVRSIGTDADGVTGVVLEDGRTIRADVVVSNADAQQTISALIGTERFPATYCKGISRLKPSVSAIVAYIATDLPDSALVSAHETFHFEDWDHDNAYQATLCGEPNWYTLTVPTLIDPDLATDGSSLLVHTSLIPFDAAHNWHESKPQHEANIIADLEQRVAGFSSHIRHIDVGTPATMKRYTQNSDGALYGWELSPRQIGPGRPAVQSPIPGLFLAGHWTQPGGGIYGVVTSGIIAARAILGHDSESDLWQALQ